MSHSLAIIDIMNRPTDAARRNATNGYYAITRWSAVVPESVGSREIRYLAVAELVNSGLTMTAVELAAAIEARGITINGQSNKVVSDALRWEVAKGRVSKPGRRRFRVGVMPRSTKAWIQGRARTHYALVARQSAA